MTSQHTIRQIFVKAWLTEILFSQRAGSACLWCCIWKGTEFGSWRLCCCSKGSLVSFRHSFFLNKSDFFFLTAFTLLNILIRCQKRTYLLHKLTEYDLFVSLLLQSFVIQFLFHKKILSVNIFLFISTIFFPWCCKFLKILLALAFISYQIIQNSILGNPMGNKIGKKTFPSSDYYMLCKLNSSIFFQEYCIIVDSVPLYVRILYRAHQPSFDCSIAMLENYMLNCALIFWVQ